ncbi:hypothetical protein PHYPSEUDO_015306 [Phytophthora pseudosyringae]|uniref:Uncharacterized protein n=1 Tax=Phytophthora pseudosyringae TaxID=221518 RepID=A0A8T1V5X8_9STRA|nr:hypothetical protein PHYPSEUDO_015306 [Phytophthora pseudosyringae]
MRDSGIPDNDTMNRGMKGTWQVAPWWWRSHITDGAWQWGGGARRATASTPPHDVQRHHRWRHPVQRQSVQRHNSGFATANSSSTDSGMTNVSSKSGSMTDSSTKHAAWRTAPRTAEPRASPR